MARQSEYCMSAGCAEGGPVYVVSNSGVLEFDEPVEVTKVCSMIDGPTCLHYDGDE